ncbi:hypothetical protein [Azospirillum sp. sgz302134]
MQTLAAYFLKADLSSAEAEARAASIDNEISVWLKEKGAEDPNLVEGSFRSLTGDGEGVFSRGRAISKLGMIANTTLVEVAHTGQNFTTAIHIIKEDSSITVFSTLSVANEKNVIAPHQVYPRCPNIVRKLIGSYEDWTFGGNPVPSGKVIDASGEAGGNALCKQLSDPKRNFPLIVVSIDPEELVWGDLANQIARDVVGLAQVAVVDEEGSWAMTAELGKADSCYLGAVRLYWPVIRGGFRNLRGTVWTPRQLRAFGNDHTGMKRFQSMLRGRVMSAAALTITLPATARSIFVGAISERISEAERAAVEKELNSIVEENEDLANKLNEANRRIADLEGKNYSLRKQVEKFEESDESIEEYSIIEKNEPLRRGDIAYYKKIGSGGGIDTLVRVDACNHKESSWQSAFKADQAVKGIAKLEGRHDWQSIQHCGACTGGGRWRVRW